MKPAPPNSAPHDEPLEESEAPLDPAAQRLQAKMKRLLMMSTVTLGIGLFAVAAAIIYRIALPEESGSSVKGSQPARMTLNFAVAADERLVAAEFEEDAVRLVLDGPQGIRLVVLDPVLGTLRLERLLPRR